MTIMTVMIVILTVIVIILLMAATIMIITAAEHLVDQAVVGQNNVTVFCNRQLNKIFYALI